MSDLENKEKVVTPEKLFIAVYEQYMKTEDKSRIGAYRFFGALEALWRLITDYNSEKLPYYYHKKPRIFWFGYKVEKESYVHLILRVSEELYKELTK